MNKTMSKIAQINKEELSAQKVELANVQEAKSLQKEMQKIEQELKASSKELADYESDLSQYEKTKQKAITKVKEVGNLMEKYGNAKNDFNSVYNGIKKQADKLGVNINDIDAIKGLSKAFDDLSDAYRPIQRLHYKVGQATNMVR